MQQADQEVLLNLFLDDSILSWTFLYVLVFINNVKRGKKVKTNFSYGVKEIVRLPGLLIEEKTFPNKLLIRLKVLAQI